MQNLGLLMHRFRNFRLWWILKIYDTPCIEQYMQIINLIDKSVLDNYNIQNAHIYRFDCIKHDLKQYCLFIDLVTEYVSYKKVLNNLYDNKIINRSLNEIIQLNLYNKDNQVQQLMYFKNKCIDFYKLIIQINKEEDLDSQYYQRVLLKWANHLNDLVLFILRFQ